MKKMIACILLMSLLFCLAACTKAGKTATTEAPSQTQGVPTTQAPEPTTAEPTTTAEPLPPEIDYAAQLQLIADACEQWKRSDPYSSYGFAVTDFDGNQRLEVLATVNMGTGHYSTTELWEVNEALDALMPCEMPYSDGDSEVDFFGVERLTVLITDDARYYVMNDGLRNGAAESYQMKYLICLKDGAVTDTYLGMMSAIADVTGVGTLTYTDASGAEIDEQTYENLYKNALPDAEEGTQKIKIIPLSEAEINAMDASGWLEILTESWNGFTAE